MSEDSWDHARLIPTSGIIGVDEQEHRATSALLAVLGGVPEFGLALIQPLGAPVGVIETFARVSFHLGDRKCFPDGLIRVRRGQRTWTALVEVRTGTTSLDIVQVETLLEVAHEEGFDAVLTISNEVSGVSGRHPVILDPGKPRAVGLHHYSWKHLLAQAMTQRELRILVDEDPGQAWVLGELIRYLEHPQSGEAESEDQDSPQIVRGVEITSQDAVVAVPEQREPVLDGDPCEPQTTVLHTVLIAEPVLRLPPTLPSRREVRIVRRLGVTIGELAAARNDAGWYQDPQDAVLLRWWDGAGWSEWTYPVQPALA